MRKFDYKKTYQDRAARTQVSFSESSRVEETGSFNVWYSKWSGDGNKFKKDKKAAEYRCNIERDAGRTKGNSKQPFCIHFAHGRCTRGVNCTFLHRIPVTGDPIETMNDCFGRDKFRSDREDMGGVGSFERRCKTLYIGNIGMNDHMEEIVRAHFSEWGEMEYVSILAEKGVAFVQYKSILNAEFAKEAMQNQKLESDEIINVRWAVEDPNPGVRQAMKRKAEEEVLESIKAQLPIVGEKGTILDYQESLRNSRLNKKKTNYQEKKITGTDPQEKPFYGEDIDQWQAYCEQYFEYYGFYPDVAGQETDESKKKGNALYTIPTASASAAPSLEGNQTLAKKQIVADYPSSDED